MDAARLFDLLDDWRHLPDYQLERRADIFFAVYLPEFLAHRLNEKHPLSLIPEFPIRLATINPDATGHLSCKVDYLAITHDRSRAFLIELKTDCSSRRDKQDDNLRGARECGLGELLEGVLQIARASHQKYKYCNLLRLLAKHSLLKLPQQLDPSSRHFFSHVRLSTVAQPCPPLAVLYLQPSIREGDASDCTCVTFSQFADWLTTNRADELASRFAQSLRAWSTTEAGRPAINLLQVTND